MKGTKSTKTWKINFIMEIKIKTMIQITNKIIKKKIIKMLDHKVLILII